MRCYTLPACVLLATTCLGCATTTPAIPIAGTPSADFDTESGPLASASGEFSSTASAAGCETGQPHILLVTGYTSATGQAETSTAPEMSLEDLEAIALAHNPAIKELTATTQKAAGYRAQVTARPNPRVGYQGQQLADEGTDQHLAFVEQEIVTGGKLQLNHRVLNATVCAQLQELEAQRLRVTTDIRIRFYEALAIQRQLQLIDDFSIVAEKGYTLAEQRKKAGEGSQIDTLQARIQKSEVGLSRRQATARLAATWREIAALAGQPNMAQAPLAGALPTETPSMEWNSLANTVVATSPEYAAARARVARARAAVERQLAQQTPNLAVQMGAGVDNGTDSGMLNVQVGVPIPLYNKNRGNIAAARAEVCRAIFEAERIENDVKARLAVVSQEYETAAAAIEQYVSEILPSASSSMELAEKAYQAGEADFVQILIARKTFYDSNVQYINAQAQLAIARAKIEGVLLTGGLDAVRDDSGDDSLRGQAFSQQ
ncbi:Cobalt-zinc-cadmium resistance protein CzcC precursor [Planctomycetes bacterium K2D]|uniref:Cobalt-zinc-cadmium resistance protein CzcC n=2 Tax=Botrimarina mediterranea TaxID=2528022 RepID=A0A518K2S8_9BACT|nr:Cobalt-zinc-cadmium resistance protein CzcC precursor [Botrimarina mediterranea]QDV76646.1 Cobalt-zinc-cadmium resistance protein CzcC precursor [Planctomycetes bacterium K2D]